VGVVWTVTEEPDRTDELSHPPFAGSCLPLAETCGRRDAFDSDCPPEGGRMASETPYRVGAGFAFGLVLIGAGVSSLLERAHVLDRITIGQWWPAVPLVVGFAKLAVGAEGERGEGWTFLAVAGWGLLVSLTSITIGQTWPALLLIWGAAIIAKSLFEAPHTENRHVR
jgi:hypothetical protein